MKLAAAARQLEVALSAVSVLSRTGQLTSIPRPTAQVVTRASVDAYSLCRRQGHRPAAVPGAVAPPGPANATQRPGPSRYRVSGTVRSGASLHE